MATATDHNTTAGLQAASDAEREAFWRETPEAERMQTWRDHMNAFLAPYTTDPAWQAGRTFLQKILRGDDETPLSAVEVSAEALYRTFMEGETRGDVAYFARRIVTTNRREEIERNQALIVELARMYGGQTSQQALALTYALKTPTVPPPYTVLGSDLHTGREIALAQRDRLQGLYLVGATGVGKSSFLCNLILSDIRAGRGVCLVEPHTDLTLQVIAHIPPERLADVIYLDVTDSNPMGLNLFQCDTPHNATEVAKVASFVMHVFEKVWHVGTATPQLAQVLRNVTRTLIETGFTFAEIPLLLWDETVREKLTANVKNTQTQLFWQQYNRKSARDKDELISSTINKIDAYLNEPMIANIMSQERSTIDFRTIMDESKILLIRMSPQLEEMSRLVGSILIGKLLTHGSLIFGPVPNIAL